MLTQKTKRKNDAPRTRRLIGLALIGGLLIIVSAILVLLQIRPCCVLPPEPGPNPSGMLYYQSGTTTHTLNLQTREQAEVTLDPQPLTQSGFPVSSPDGLWQASWIGSPEGFMLSIQSTTAQQALSPVTLFTADPTTSPVIWSPDSRWLVVAVDQRRDSATAASYLRDTWLVHRESGEAHLLGANPLIGDTARFNPASTKLAYLNTFDNIAIMELSSRETHDLVHPNLSKNPIKSSNLVWSPDSEWLAYLRESPHDGIWIARTDGSELRHLISNTIVHQILDWRP